jgi:hypothetical protein
MRRRSLLALLAIATFAAAVVVGLGATAASAGEVTGNCKNDNNAQAADNCKDDYSNGNSECKFSGQNDVPEGSADDGIGGTSQSYGQDVKAGQAFPDGTPDPPGTVPIDPNTQNKGHTDTPQPQPGYQCNGHDNPQP